MKEKTKEILNNGIDLYLVYYNKQDNHAANGLHLMIGKITLAVELGLITLDEMDLYLDLIFEKYGQLKE